MVEGDAWDRSTVEVYNAGAGVAVGAHVCVCAHVYVCVSVCTKILGIPCILKDAVTASTLNVACFLCGNFQSSP
jgi:hypothetical protein